ncbi:MAG: PhoU domain-containing protein [Thiohalocapsa sp.]
MSSRFGGGIEITRILASRPAGHKRHIVSAYDRELTRLRAIALEMVERTLDQTQLAVMALVEGGAAEARRVLEREPQLDALNLDAGEEVFRIIARRQPTATDLLTTTHTLERIGSHASNIAEQVIYVVEGEDVRYRNRELLIQNLPGRAAGDHRS